MPHATIVYGTLTDDDLPALTATLADAGIEGVDPVLTPSGTVYFVLTKPTKRGNDLGYNPELRDRVAAAVDEAGWKRVQGHGVLLDLTGPPDPEDGSPARELWTTQQVADYLGITRDSARKQLSRWGITAAHRYWESVGGYGKRNLLHSLFLSTEVRAAHAARPGRGARTDRAAEK